MYLVLEVGRSVLEDVLVVKVACGHEGHQQEADDSGENWGANGRHFEASVFLSTGVGTQLGNCRTATYSGIRTCDDLLLASLIDREEAASSSGSSGARTVLLRRTFSGGARAYPESPTSIRR